jgi:hypothetical protein
MARDLTPAKRHRKDDGDDADHRAIKRPWYVAILKSVKLLVADVCLGTTTTTPS